MSTFFSIIVVLFYARVVSRSCCCCCCFLCWKQHSVFFFCYFSFGLVWNLSSKIKRGVIVYFFVQHRWGYVACHFHAYLHKYVCLCADVRLWVCSLCVLTYINIVVRVCYFFRSYKGCINGWIIMTRKWFIYMWAFVGLYI